LNIEIMRAFVRLRAILATHADLARKLVTLEKKYDSQFRVPSGSMARPRSSHEADLDALHLV
jgi:hypothetical protein